MSDLILKLMMDDPAPAGSAPASGTGWDIGTFLSNLEGSITSWGTIIVTIIGLVMVIVGVFKIAQGLMSGGRGQTNWVLSIGLILIGGILAFSSGWTLLQNLGRGADDTLNHMGTSGGGVILPMLRAMLPF